MYQNRESSVKLILNWFVQPAHPEPPRRRRQLLRWNLTYSLAQTPLISRIAVPRLLLWFRELVYHILSSFLFIPSCTCVQKISGLYIPIRARLERKRDSFCLSYTIASHKYASCAHVGLQSVFACFCRHFFSLTLLRCFRLQRRVYINLENNSIIGCYTRMRDNISRGARGCTNFLPPYYNWSFARVFEELMISWLLMKRPRGNYYYY